MLLGQDGLARCPWANSATDYAVYHDTEWGVPLTGEIAMFERLCLESFQSGLSWLVILRKREAFRRAFAGFDPARVAEFDAGDVEELVQNQAIVRNRAKIEAVIANARLIPGLELSLDELLWSFAPDPAEHTRPTSPDAVPSTSPASRAMAAELKRRGFSFVGPTTCYALMQATGMVDDHVEGCWLAE
ncbi:DNA-3-methyladenine glycosylase I [Haloechinothrix sp. LS1_15]|uniref:DNA-3-methyladenine glycosylase I n=1 Tax=Haloechinothrix sp. LS1_15 TaxID=2652248 RepID=UPI0029454F95|nr:DNA-3-methyladenine glycosylase I [Haloechinothrix sp. LS1_15]MDV6013900.1 DNA-3-methyladenine glycosylase I [Haloechinothrix sp. LS1_15]